MRPTHLLAQIVENTGHVVDYTYDDLYRLTEEKVTQNDYVTGFSYQYDKVGNRIYETQFDGPTQVQTQYTYDDNDRLTKQGGVQKKKGSDPFFLSCVWESG
jgi:YD repeat-containing protein